MDPGYPWDNRKEENGRKGRLKVPGDAIKRWKRSLAGYPALFWGILLGGSLLRIYRIAQPSLWHDEFCTIYRSNLSFLGMLQDVSINPFPPLYYMVMHSWVNLAGTSHLAVRSPSFVASALGIVAIYRLAIELYDQRTALLAAFFVAISPYAINYAQEAKMYSMFWLFATLSFLYFHRLLREHDGRNLRLYVGITAAMIYVSYLGFLMLVIQSILWVTLKKPVRAWAKVQGWLFVLYLPWLFFCLRIVQHGYGLAWIPKRELGSFVKDIFLMITGIHFGSSHTIGLFEVAIYLLLLVISVFVLLRLAVKERSSKRSLEDILVLSWFFMPVMVLKALELSFGPLSIERYVGEIHLPFFVLIARGLLRMPLRLRGGVVTFLVFATFSLHLSPYYEKSLKIYGEEWQELFLELKAKGLAETYILIRDAEISRLIATYYLGDFPNLRVAPAPDTALFSELHGRNAQKIIAIYRGDRRLKAADTPWFRKAGDHRFRDNIGYIEYQKADP